MFGVVRDIADGGEGVVVVDQHPVALVPGVCVGEKVHIRVRHKHKDWLQAELIEVIEPSQHRVTPACVWAEACGGCALMHMDWRTQQKLKEDLVLRHLSRLAQKETYDFAFVSSPIELGYRRRARLSWFKKGTSKWFGYRARRSSQVADIEHCLVLHPTLDQAFAELRIRLLGVLQGQGTAWLALGQTEKPVVFLESADAQSATVYQLAEGLWRNNQFSGVALALGGVQSKTVWGDAREWSMPADKFPFVGPIGGFSQAHHALNDTLVRTVCEVAQVEYKQVLELYAGSGNLTVGLARQAQKLVAVESDAQATEACRQNLALRGLDKVRVETRDVAQFEIPKNLDVVVLDPPRTGASQVVAAITQAKPKRIVYVSCFPVTLERDLKRFLSAGYCIERVVALDMFPQTAHVEIVASLVYDA